MAVASSALVRTRAVAAALAPPRVTTRIRHGRDGHSVATSAVALAEQRRCLVQSAAATVASADVKLAQHCDRRFSAGSNAQTTSQHQEAEPVISGPGVGGDQTSLWTRFVQWSYTYLGQWVFPQTTSICNCGADLGILLPQPELLHRPGVEQGTKEWQMQMFGASLYWHVATVPGEKPAQANPEMLSGADVLEVACMRGGGAHYLTQVVKPRLYVATDVVQANINYCQKEHAPLPELRFETADAMQLEAAYTESSFDFVICIQAASSFEDLARFVRGAAHVLRPGGRLLVTDGFTRNKLQALLNTMIEVGLDLDACADISRNVHAVGLCTIPNGLSFMRVVGRKASADNAV
mmetsp:Transcript_65966/g.127279  ORF Transcript_65966/g.127279 Transcript_65966/m.127279 type:complete len:351 (-) Transcript_65966:34-1086(-)